MSVGVILGVLGLLLLASSANCKFYKFVFAVYIYGMGILHCLLQSIVWFDICFVYPAQQVVEFAEADYEVVENNPPGRTLLITKDGPNVGTIMVTLQFFSLQQFRDMGFSESPFDTADTDTAESV